MGNRLLGGQGIVRGTHFGPIQSPFAAGLGQGARSLQLPCELKALPTYHIAFFFPLETHMALLHSHPPRAEGRRLALTSRAGPQHSPVWTLNLPPSPLLCKGLGGCWEGSREQALYIPLREARRHHVLRMLVFTYPWVFQLHPESPCPTSRRYSQGHTHWEIPVLWLPRASLSKCFSFPLLSDLSPRRRTIL